MRHLLIIALLLTALNNDLWSQCSCTDCPIFVASNTTVTSEIDVSGLVNGTLGEGGQGVCGISINFTTDAVDELTFSVTAPDGSMIDLFVQTGISVGQNITYDILFIPCADTPMPDTGFSPQFDSAEPWMSNGNYFGSYHPSFDCLEDFTGPANGTWTLTMTDFIGADDSNLFDWQLIFCDGTGTDCGEEPSCAADAGTIEIDPMDFCEGDAALDFSLSPSYTGDAPDAATYGYQYVITDTDGNVIEYTDDPDMTTYGTGNYSVCGMSYLLTDQTAINVLPNTISDIENNIANFVYCADVFCVEVNINEDFDDVVMDWDGIDFLCADQDYTFSVVNFDPNLDYLILINSGVFNSTSGVNGSITINPASGSPTVEICVSVNADCNPMEICKQFDVIGGEDPLLLDYPEEVCIENSFLISVLNNPPADDYTWTISGPGLIDFENGTEAQISPSGEGTITVCITPSSIDCGDGEEECIDIEVIDPPPPTINTDLTACLPGGNLSVDLFGPMSTVEWSVVSGPGSFQILNPTLANTNYNVDLPGFYEIQVVENIGDCERTNSVLIEVVEPTQIMVENICSDGEYTTTVTFLNGTAPYFIDGSQIAGNSFTFGPNASGSSFTFTYSDVHECTETEMVTESCPCVSEAGTMDETPIEVCDGQEIMATHNGDQYLDANDAGQYILTTSSVNPANTIVQTSDSGIFDFLPPLTYNTTYYIFYIVGDASGNTIDLNDPCLSISNFQTVIWHEPPVITMPEDISTCAFEVDVTVTSNIAVTSSWILTGSPTGGMAVIDNPAGLSTQISFTLPGVYTFQYTATTALCTVVEELQVEIFEPIQIINIEEICDGLTYTVSFEIVNGASPFNINGTVIYSTFYQSEPIASGNSYDFIITDDNGCMYTDLFGQKNCECDSDAGTMNLDPIEVCPTDISIQGEFNDDATLEVDDAGMYVLHEGSGVVIENMIDANASGSFNFNDAVMNSGQTYYISYVVGNDDGQGGVDLGDPCLDIAPGQAVVWNDPPLSLLDSEYFTCTDSLLVTSQEIASDFSNIQWSLIDGPIDASLSILNLNATEFILVVDAPGSFHIEVEIDRDDCITLDTIQLINNKIILDQITYECDSLTGNYSATVLWNGGMAPFYIGSDTIYTNEYTIEDLTSGSTFTIDISDTLNCVLEGIEGSTVCDCFPPLHEMFTDTLSTCDTTFTFEILPESIDILSDEDVSTFIMHTENAASLGTIIQIDSDGIFGFNNMELDVVYFISFVSGDSLADGSIDLDDPCLSVAVGQPIVYYSTPSAVAGVNQLVCGTSHTLSGQSNAEEVEWQIISSVQGSNPVLDDASSLNTEFSTDEYGEYILMLTATNNGCTSMDTMSLTFYPPLDISPISYICSDDNSTYTATFEISGGLPPYFVDGMEIVGNSFSSQDLDNLSSFLYLVEDSGPCMGIEASGSFDCSCTSLPGNLIPDAIDLCEGDELVLNYETDPITDMNFEAGFILHDGNAQMLGNILLITNEATIPYDMSYPLDQVLYVTPFVGEGDINSIDLDDPCTLFGEGIEVVWQSTAQLQFTNPGILCEGDTLIFELNLTAPQYPQIIEISGPDFNVQGTITDASAHFFEIAVSTGGIYDILLDEALCLADNTPLSFNIESENCDCLTFSFQPEENLCTSLSSINLDTWIIEEGEGVWEITSSNSATPPILQDNILLLDNASKGETELSYVSTLVDACDSTYSFTISIESPLDLSLLQENILLCHESNSEIGLSQFLSDSSIEGQWTALTEIPEGTLQEGIVSTFPLLPGNYLFEYVLTEQPLICPFEPVIFELVITPPIDYIITSTNPDCFGEDGSLLIEVLGGPPFVNTITLNGEIIEDPDISGLSPGEYQITLSDENLCMYLEDVLIEDAEQLNVELEGTIDSGSDGNTAIVNAFSDIRFEDVNITWFSNGSEIIGENDSILFLNIFEDTEIAILLEDENGCSVEDLILLSLEEVEIDISLPNVLSIDGNGRNSGFQVPPYASIKMVEELAIYDRWGEKVYTTQNYDPKQELRSWDGTLNGKEVSLGVYVYKLVYLDNDDRQQVLFGDVAVIR